MFSLENKTAVVTGGASGIGKAICELFAQKGAQVILVDRDEDRGNQVAAAIRQRGGKAEVRVCDVSKQQEVMQVIKELDRVDVLVNNAGVAHIGRADTTSEEDFDRIYSINIKGVYNFLKACLPKMKEQKQGSIINLASIASLVGIPDRFAYSMSKGAVAAMTLSVAKDYLEDGVRCNSISPARVHTPFVDGFLANNYPGKEEEMFVKLSKTQPIGRMATPEEVAALALYLASDQASFITGNDYPIDGGFVKLNN